MSLESMSEVNAQLEYAPKFPDILSRCGTFQEVLNCLESASKQYPDLVFRMRYPTTGQSVDERTYTAADEYAKLLEIYTDTSKALAEPENSASTATFIDTQAKQIPRYARELFKAAFIQSEEVMSEPKETDSTEDQYLHDFATARNPMDLQRALDALAQLNYVFISSKNDGDRKITVERPASKLAEDCRKIASALDTGDCAKVLTLLDDPSVSNMVGARIEQILEGYGINETSKNFIINIAAERDVNKIIVYLQNYLSYVGQTLTMPKGTSGELYTAEIPALIAFLHNPTSNPTEGVRDGLILFPNLLALVASRIQAFENPQTPLQGQFETLKRQRIITLENALGLAKAAKESLGNLTNAPEVQSLVFALNKLGSGTTIQLDAEAGVFQDDVTRVASNLSVLCLDSQKTDTFFSDNYSDFQWILTVPELKKVVEGSELGKKRLAIVKKNLNIAQGKGIQGFLSKLFG